MISAENNGIVVKMTSGPYLSPQQERTWNLLIGVMVWLPAGLDSYLEHTAGLSHPEYQVLRWLSLSEDHEIRMGHLATTASVTPSHLSRIVARLENRGTLKRSPDPTDARRTLARLTDAGARIVEKIEPAYAAEVRRCVFDHLQQQDVDHLEDIAEAILTPLHSDCVASLPPRSARP